MSMGWGAQFRSPARMTGFRSPSLARCAEKDVSQALTRYSSRFKPSPAFGTYTLTTAHTKHVLIVTLDCPVSYRYHVSMLGAYLC